MHFLEKTGRNVDEAIKSALDELGYTIDQVDVTVIESGSKGFLGIGSKKAKVRVTKNFDPEYTAKKFVTEIMSAMGIDFNIDIILRDKKYLHIKLNGENMSVLIGKRGQTLESLQYLINLVVNKGSDPYVNVILNIGDYREKRKIVLEKLAYNLAEKVKATKKSIELEPMISSERRIIHTTLQSNIYVSTCSRGEEPRRSIVIAPR